MTAAGLGLDVAGARAAGSKARAVVSKVGGRKLKLPAGACDSHVHVFRPDIYPYAKDRAYTPGRVTAKDLRGFLSVHSLDRVVIVQPSVYGIDNRAMLDGVRQSGQRARGIAVVDLAKVKDRQLADLEKAGVAGIRLNVNTRKEGNLAKVAKLAAARLAGSSWLIQVYAPLADIVAARRTLARLSLPVVLDHFAGARLRRPELAEGTKVLIDLARNGPAYLKLSAPYRVVTGEGADKSRWDGVRPLARKLLAAGADKLIWGSDWPHTGGHDRRGGSRLEIEPFQKIDDRHGIRLLAEWLDDDDLLRRVLVDNPARLYRFGKRK
jgi:predicted TIM-barrel fold metal-dependent hydrolase